MPKKRPRDGIRKFLISMRGGLQKHPISLWGGRWWSDLLSKLTRGGLIVFQISLQGTPRKTKKTLPGGPKSQSHTRPHQLFKWNSPYYAVSREQLRAGGSFNILIKSGVKVE